MYGDSAGAHSYDDNDEYGYDEEEIDYAMRGMSMQDSHNRQAMDGRSGGMESRAAFVNRNFTFTNTQMNSIGRENATLLRKLQTIAMKGSGAVEGAKPAAATKRLSSHEINRRKKQQEIAHANMRIASRLQNAKGTFDSRRMREDQANQEKYLRNVAQYPVTQRDAPYRSKPAASSRPPWFKELPQMQRRVARPEWQS